MIAEVGKDVTDFAKGDRCVADPGVTVSLLSVQPKAHLLNSLASVVLASTADAGSRCCARTSRAKASAQPSQEVSASTSHCELSYHAHIALPHLTSPSPSSAHKVYKITNLTDEEATLIEPAACAVHGMDKLGTAVGIDALVIGAGPTGLVLAQLLKLNGATRVVVAANKGIKTELAKQLEAAHEYVELDRQDPDAQWAQLKKDNPYGFDVVVRASHSRY